MMELWTDLIWLRSLHSSVCKAAMINQARPHETSVHSGGSPAVGLFSVSIPQAGSFDDGEFDVGLA